jgi:hypothetical protein
LRTNARNTSNAFFAGSAIFRLSSSVRPRTRKAFGRHGRFKDLLKNGYHIAISVSIHKATIQETRIAAPVLPIATPPALGFAGRPDACRPQPGAGINGAAGHANRREPTAPGPNYCKIVKISEKQ